MVPTGQPVRFNREHVHTVPVVESFNTVAQPRYGRRNRLLECIQTLRLESLVPPFRKHDSHLPFLCSAEHDNDLTESDIERRLIGMVIEPSRTREQHTFPRSRLASWT